MINLTYTHSTGFNLLKGENNLLKKVASNFTFEGQTERLVGCHAAYIISGYLALLDVPKEELYAEVQRLTQQILTDYPYEVTAKNANAEFSLKLCHQTRWGNEQLLFSIVPGLAGKLRFGQVMIEENKTSGAEGKILKDLAMIQQAYQRMLALNGEQTGEFGKNLKTHTMNTYIQ